MVALVAHAASLCAQSTQPGTALAMTAEAKAQFDSLAAKAASTHAEQSACVTGFALHDSLFIIGELGPAHNVVASDSVSISMSGPPCAWWQPGIHTHVLDNGYLQTPSGIDYHTTAMRGVFGFLVSVHKDSSWSLKPYP